MITVREGYTPLGSRTEERFQDWYKTLPKDLQDKKDYDFRGFFRLARPCCQDEE